MPKRSEYRQGTPNWVDLQTTDQSAAKKFYTSLFGWGYDGNPVPGGGGVYSMATLNGEAVAAIAPMPPGAPEGMPPIWNTYIAVDDVDAVVDKVVPGGGQVMMPAFDIGDAGRMSFITDPTGAAVGLWQANRHIGATLVNETCTHILAWEGDDDNEAKWFWFEGNFGAYEENKVERLGVDAARPHRVTHRKLTRG